MSEKICNICQVVKSLEEYTNNKRRKDGKENYCKKCEKEKREQKKDKLSESQKRWRAKNPDYMKEYNKKDIRKDYMKQYYKENSQVYKDRKKQSRIENPEIHKERDKKYKENNRDKVNKYHRRWKQKKRESDINYKIKENISRRIRYELTTLLKGKKTKRTTAYIGCSMEDLKKYLENQFNESMTWENYGTAWHIDHKIPCAAWDLTKEDENMYCWNFRNLQPLDASENQSKKDKYDPKEKDEYVEKMKNLLGSESKE